MSDYIFVVLQIYVSSALYLELYNVFFSLMD